MGQIVAAVVTLHVWEDICGLEYAEAILCYHYRVFGARVIQVLKNLKKFRVDLETHELSSGTTIRFWVIFGRNTPPLDHLPPIVVFLVWWSLANRRGQTTPSERPKIFRARRKRRGPPAHVACRPRKAKNFSRARRVAPRAHSPQTAWV